MRKYCCFSLVIFLISFILPGCGTKDAEVSTKIDAGETPKSPFVEQYGEYKPQLWLIEKDNNKVFLLGSIHVGVDGMYPLPDAITDAFNNSSVLAVENDIVELANDKQYLATIPLYFSDKKSIKSSLSEEDFTNLTTLLKEYGFDIEASPNFKPMFFQMLIPDLLFDDSTFKTDHGVDRHFLVEAKNKGMKIKDIEDPLYIYTHLSALPNKTQVFLLNNTVKLYQDKEARQKETKTCLDHGLMGMWVNS